MFEAFFHLSGLPFARHIAVDKLLETPSRKELHGRLNHVAKTLSFGVFTGDAGTGKTTALRKFAQSLDTNRYQVLYISDSALTPRNFYWEALHQLGCEPRFYRGDAKRQLQKALASLSEHEKRNPVIIADEAHLLSREMLEEIRFLLNLNFDSHSALCLILAGQSELRDTLKLQVNEAIAQRVDLRFHLYPMTLEESSAYVSCHLKAVDAPQEIFTQAALALLHEYCHGNPRRINKVATACLMAAASKNIALVDDHLLRLVIENEFEF